MLAGRAGMPLSLRSTSKPPLRLEAPQRRILEGRCIASFIAVLGGIFFVSYYGIPGKPIVGQLQTLAALGQLVKGCGLPFAIVGDWQVSLIALAESKFPHRLGAEIMTRRGPYQFEVWVDFGLLRCVQVHQRCRFSGTGSARSVFRAR